MTTFAWSRSSGQAGRDGRACPYRTADLSADQSDDLSAIALAKAEAFPGVVKTVTNGWQSRKHSTSLCFGDEKPQNAACPAPSSIGVRQQPIRVNDQDPFWSLAKSVP